MTPSWNPYLNYICLGQYCKYAHILSFQAGIFLNSVGRLTCYNDLNSFSPLSQLGNSTGLLTTHPPMGVVSGKSMGSVSTQTHFESWLCHWPASGHTGHLTSPHTPIFTSQMSKLYLLNLGELYSPINVTWLVLNKQRTPLMPLTFVNTQEIRLA